MTASWSAAYAPHGSPASSRPADWPALRCVHRDHLVLPGVRGQRVNRRRFPQRKQPTASRLARASGTRNPVPCSVYQILASPSVGRTAPGSPRDSSIPGASLRPGRLPRPESASARTRATGAPARRPAAPARTTMRYDRPGRPRPACHLRPQAGRRGGSRGCGAGHGRLEFSARPAAAGSQPSGDAGGFAGRAAAASVSP